MADVVLHGFEEMGRGFENAEALFLPLASQATGEALQAIQARISVEPPQPSRTRSKHFNTYVRGQGRYPKSAFISDTSQPGGYAVRKTPKAQVKHTSQNLLKRFTIMVHVTKTEVQGRLENGATYSGWVLGSKDLSQQPHQVPWHTQTGWTAKEDALEQAMPDIEQSLGVAIDKLIQAFRSK